MARGPKTAANGQIVPRQEQRPAKVGADLEAAIKRRKNMLAEALPKHVDKDRMLRVMLTAVRTVRHLAECDGYSVLACMAQCSQLGLEVNTPMGHAYLIPRRSRGGYECTTIIGYQGFIELALRSGKVTSIWAHVVREGDEFRIWYGLRNDIEHVPSNDEDRDERPITHVYAVAKLANGDHVFKALSRAQVLKRKARSGTANSNYSKSKDSSGTYDEFKARSGTANSNYSPWTTDEEAMYLKTAVRALWPWLPKSAESAMAAAFDSARERGQQHRVIDADVAHVVNGIAASEGILPPPSDPGSNGQSQEPPPNAGDAWEPDEMVQAGAANA